MERSFHQSNTQDQSSHKILGGKFSSNLSAGQETDSGKHSTKGKKLSLLLLLSKRLGLAFHKVVMDTYRKQPGKEGKVKVSVLTQNVHGHL